MKFENIIIGTFVKKTKILSFLEFLHNRFKININKAFIFTVEDNDKEYLVTFSVNRNNNIFPKLHDATVLHVKNGCLFSINALNKYIEQVKDEYTDNVDYNVEWDDLKDILLITTNDMLKMPRLNKISDRCDLLDNLLK